MFLVAIVEGFYIFDFNQQLSELRTENTKIQFFSREINKSQKDDINNYPIDFELEKCCSENYMTNDMNKCTNVAIDAWNKEIIFYTNKLKRTLNIEQKQIFKNAEIAWKNYYQNEKVFLENSVGQQEGDIHTTYVMGYLYDLTKYRAINLQYYYNNLNEK